MRRLAFFLALTLSACGGATNEGKLGGTGGTSTPGFGGDVAVEDAGDVPASGSGGALGAVGVVGVLGVLGETGGVRQIGGSGGRGGSAGSGGRAGTGGRASGGAAGSGGHSATGGTRILDGGSDVNSGDSGGFVGTGGAAGTGGSIGSGGMRPADGGTGAGKDSGAAIPWGCETNPTTGRCVCDQQDRALRDGESRTCASSMCCYTIGPKSCTCSGPNLGGTSQDCDNLMPALGATRVVACPPPTQ